MSRMKAHWPEGINPNLELLQAIRWQKDRLHKCNIYECVAICEAIQIMEMARDAVCNVPYWSERW